MTSNAKKVVVLGATGPLGLQLVHQALQRGYEVVAFVRDPPKLAASLPGVHDKLRVAKGDIFRTADLTAAFGGCAAVLSALGCKQFSKATTFYEDSCSHIVEAMKAAGVRRLIAVTAWYTHPSGHEPCFMSCFVKPLFLGRIFESMGRMEDRLERRQYTADVEYTIVRPPRLTHGALTSKPIVTEVDNVCVTSVRDNHDIARADVARFMLDVLEQNSHIRQAVAIITPR